MQESSRLGDVNLPFCSFWGAVPLLGFPGTLMKSAFTPSAFAAPAFPCLLGSRGALCAHRMDNVLHLSTARSQEYAAVFPVVKANKPVGLFGCERWLPFSVWDVRLVNCLDRTDWLKEARILDQHWMAAGSTTCYTGNGLCCQVSQDFSC